MRASWVKVRTVSSGFDATVLSGQAECRRYSARMGYAMITITLTMSCAGVLVTEGQIVPAIMYAALMTVYDIGRREAQTTGKLNR